MVHGGANVSEINRLQDAKPSSSPAAAAKTWPETGVAEQAAHQAAAVAQHSARTTGEALRRGADATADVTRQGAKAGVEAVRRVGETANETVRRSTQVMAEGQRQIAQETAQTFEAVSRKMAQAAQGASDDIRQFMTLPHAAEGGLRDMQQGMAGLVEGVVQTNLRATQELFRVSNPAAVVELQQRFVQEYMDTLMQGTATMLRAIRRTADETLRPLEAQVGQRQQARQYQRSAAE